MCKLSNKVAIVTGGSSGIGKSIALEFAREGATVVVVCNNNVLAGEDVVETILSFGGNAVCYKANVGNLDEIKSLFDFTLDKFGTVDILVNNAGILDDLTVASNISDDLWDNVLNINTTSVMRTCREVLPIFMSNRSGVILNVGSVASLSGSRGGLAYTASKHAVLGMTKNIGYQYADYGIRCNMIAPGVVPTSIGSIPNVDVDGNRFVMQGVNLVPRFGNVDEVAKCAVFLVSDDSSYVNGSVLTVDGGWMSY